MLSYERRLWILLFAAVCLTCHSGCVLPFVYAYPQVGYTPPIALHPQGAPEVVAFRAVHKNCGASLEFPGESYLSLTQISRKEDHVVPAQFTAGVAHGWYWFMVALSYGQHHDQSVSVRLYRPGYETLEIGSDADSNKIVWKRAETLEVRETAIDNLLSRRVHPTEAESLLEDRQRFLVTLDSEAERNAALFAATEYERLAATIDPIDVSPESNRRALLDKAQKLKQRIARPDLTGAFAAKAFNPSSVISVPIGSVSVHEPSE